MQKMKINGASSASFILHRMLKKKVLLLLLFVMLLLDILFKKIKILFVWTRVNKTYANYKNCFLYSRLFLWYSILCLFFLFHQDGIHHGVVIGNQRQQAFSKPTMTILKENGPLFFQLPYVSQIYSKLPINKYKLRRSEHSLVIRVYIYIYIYIYICSPFILVIYILFTK